MGVYTVRQYDIIQTRSIILTNTVNNHDPGYILSWFVRHASPSQVPPFHFLPTVLGDHARSDQDVRGHGATLY